MLPLYHVAGWVVAFLPNALVGGAAVIPDVGFDVATVAVGVPGGTGSASAGHGRAATESALRAAAAARGDGRSRARPASTTI